MKIKIKKINIIFIVMVALVMATIFRKNIFENISFVNQQGAATLTSQDQQMYIVTVMYMHKNGSLAADRDVYCFSKTGNSSTDDKAIKIGADKIKKIDGYTADITEINEPIDDGLLARLDSYDYVEVKEDEMFSNIHKIYYTITYTPAPSSYKVSSYYENVDGTYTKKETETFSDNVFIGDRVEAHPKEVEGFSINNEKSIAYGDVAKDGSTELQMYYDRNLHYVYLDPTGGTYYDPIIRKYGENINVNNYKPTMDGYSFAGWDCVDRATGNVITAPTTMPNAEVFYKAKWKVENTSFSITYFVENPDDENYSNIGTYTVNNVKSGTVVSDITNLQNYINTGFSNIKGSEVTYFTYDSAKSEPNFNIEIKGDGTTSVIAYYSRNEYTLSFSLGTVSGSNKRYYYNASQYRTTTTNITMDFRGTTYQIGGTQYTLTAKYGQNIAALWPSFANATISPGSIRYSSRYTYSPYGWSYTQNNGSNVTQVSGVYNLTAQFIGTDGKGKSFLLLWNSDSIDYTGHYMLETYDGTGTSYNGSKFKEQTDYAVKVTSNNLSHKNIEHFTFNENERVVNGNDIYLYYHRNKYNLKFYNVINTMDITNNISSSDVVPGMTLTNDGLEVYYGVNLSSLENLKLNSDQYPIQHLGTGWTFGGWYQDEGCTVPMNWNMTMIDDIVVYAKWIPPTYNITRHLMGGRFTVEPLNYTKIEDELYLRVVDEGITLAILIPPVKDGYEFKGWFYTDESGNEYEYIFSDSQKVYSDIDLYAKWEAYNDGDYQVKFVEAQYDSSGNLIKDINRYNNPNYLREDKVYTDTVKYGTIISENAEFISPNNGKMYIVDEYVKQVEITTNEENNIIYFFYTPVDQISYKVKYVEGQYDEAGNIITDISKYNNPNYLKKDKEVTVKDLDSLIVRENSEIIDGYEATKYQDTLALTTNTENNVIYFFYEPVSSKGYYEINYYFMDENGNYPSNPDVTKKDEASVGTYIYGTDYYKYLPADDPHYLGHELDNDMTDVLMVVISSGETSTMNIYFKNTKYTVTYDTDAGTWNDTSEGIYTKESDNIYKHETIYNKKAPIPTEPTKSGYTFAGWYDTATGTAYDFNQGITEDKYLKAKWIELKSVTIQKEWQDNDNQDGYRTNNVTVHILNGTELVRDVMISSLNEWSAVVNDLPVTDLDDNEIIYTIVEEPVENYTAEYTYDGDTWTVTNTHIPETTNIEMTKIWNDGNDQDGLRPNSIGMLLKADGVLVQNITLNEGNGWKDVVKDLPVYKSGNKIDYTIEEELLEGYVSEVTETENSFVVTNTHELEKININVEKKWDDDNNRDGKRPDSLEVYLKSNGTIVDTQVLSDANSWKYNWTDLDKNSNGRKIEYTVEEQAVDNYTLKSVFNTTTSTWELTNVHENELKDINIDKIWDDDNNRDGKRPEKIIVNLNGNGQFIGTKTLTPEEGWHVVFKDMPVYENGAAIDYTINEINVPDYTTDIVKNENGFVITNTHEPEVTSKTITKVWRDGNNKDNTRPDSAQVRLLKNGQDYSGIITLTEADQAANSDEWAVTFDNLYVYENGQLINYTAEEVVVPEGYGVIYNQRTLRIYNAYPPEIQCSVEKIWNDEDDADGIRPEKIAVQLLANGSPYTLGGENIGYVELSKENNWEHTWDFIEKYDDDGERYEYTLQEVNVGNASYTSSITTKDDNNPEFQCTYLVTNSHVPEKTSRTVKKVWADNDNQDGLRPTQVRIHLMANGEEVSDALLNEQNNWEYTFENINVNKNGEPIVYTVTEDYIEKYYTEIVNTDANTFTVTNTHIPEEKEITIRKTWDDNDNQDGIRPASVSVNVKANEEIVRTVDLTDYVVIDKLPVYKNGERITYSVEEINIPDKYTPRYANIGDDYEVINMHTPEQRTINIEKIWSDDNNRDGIRPLSINVALKGNDKVVKDNIILNSSANWNSEVTVDKYENGKEINYTINENSMDEYTASYNYDLENNKITIENTHIPATKVITINKIWEDEENIYNKRPENIVVDIFANGTKLTTATIEESSNWQVSIGGLYSNENGKEIEYTVKEAEQKINYTAKVEKDGDTFKLTNTINTNLIKTRVEGIGGNISGKGLQYYEKVVSGDSNIKPVVIKPDVGYEIKKIMVNGLEQVLPQDKKSEYTLPAFDTITEDKEIVVEFKKIEYKITTEVVGGNGTISGEGQDPYEIVEHGDTSIKDIIVKPDDTYKVSKITVNGQVINIPNDVDYEYLLDKFENVTENIHIIVEFERKPAKVIVSYVTTKGEILAENDEIDGLMMDPYETSAKEFNEYILTKMPENYEGIMNEEEINVVYVYEHRISINISKTVKGNYAQLSRKFEFEVNLKDFAGNSYNQSVTYNITDNQNNVISIGEINDGVKTIELQHNQILHLTQIPEDVDYTIKEINCDDYVTTINGTASNSKEAKGITKDTITYHYVNTKEYASPTGIMLNILPFGLGIVIIGIIIVALRKYKINNRE